MALDDMDQDGGVEDGEVEVPLVFPQFDHFVLSKREQQVRLINISVLVPLTGFVHHIEIWNNSFSFQPQL